MPSDSYSLDSQLISPQLPLKAFNIVLNPSFALKLLSPVKLLRMVLMITQLGT